MTNNPVQASDLLLSFSSAGGRAGRTYMSSTSFLFTLERLGNGSLLKQGKTRGLQPEGAKSEQITHNRYLFYIVYESRAVGELWVVLSFSASH